MKYEWDEKKRQDTLKERSLDFASARYAFTDDAFVIEDTRKDYNEPRYILIGLLFERIVVIAFTIRNDVIRIISMRKANKREQRRYHEKKEKGKQ